MSDSASPYGEVLVTGADGFIGGLVCRRLSSEGYQVTRVVHPDKRPLGASPETLYIDLERPGALERGVSRAPGLVIHLAALLPQTFEGLEASGVACRNRAIDQHVLLACQAWGAGAVYASGTSVYGFGDGFLKDECAPVAPIGPYAAGKLAGERAGAELLKGCGLTFAVLRINAPYGQGQGARTVLNLFIERAIAELALLYDGSGSRQQDFTNVVDVAEAVLKAVQLRRSGIYNIAGGRPVTMLELACLVVSCVPGCTSDVLPSGRPDSQEGATALFSIEKALKELRWQPRIPLEEGIRTLVQDRLNKLHADRIAL